MNPWHLAVFLLPQVGRNVNRDATSRPGPTKLFPRRQRRARLRHAPLQFSPPSGEVVQDTHEVMGRDPARGFFLYSGRPMEKIPMTRRGFDALDAELKQLKTVDRPAIIRDIAEAREHGDLSENAEYHAAREKQGFIEGRIKELEGILSKAEVIDPTKLSGSVKFGATVALADEDSGEEKTYQIVGETEADIENGLLNIRSPLARALIGKEEGDSVDVKTPGGSRSYEILSIRYV
jgi:transcription elongation factor GreA